VTRSPDETSQPSNEHVSRMSAFAGRSVFVTGHTGFKGSWLALWLDALGAKVTGYALDPPTDPSNYAASGVSEVLVDDVRGDIRDGDRLERAVSRSGADFVFHLAAQPIVRASLQAPRDRLGARCGPRCRSAVRGGGGNQ
jgi:CDP-glucose 4,6-dehydratase